jgi:hypothetical protein
MVLPGHEYIRNIAGEIGEDITCSLYCERGNTFANRSVAQLSLSCLTAVQCQQMADKWLMNVDALLTTR